MPASNIVKTLVELIRGGVKHVLMVALACWVLVVIPNDWQERLGMSGPMNPDYSRRGSLQGRAAVWRCQGRGDAS